MADLDLAELRRLAENATDYPAARDLDGWGWEMARTADNPLGDQVRLYFDPPQVRYVAAVPPDVVLALLDRLEAAEVWDYGTRVGLHNDLSYAEGTVVGYDLHRRRYKVEVDGYGRTEWVPRSQLRPLPPLSAAVPGAVAGEPESTPAAELPFRSYPEFLRRFLPEEAERRRRAGMTPSEVAQEIGREAAAEALAAFTRAADTQEAGDA